VEAENRHVATERLNLAGKIAENISDRLNSPPHGVLPLLNNAARNLRVNPAEAKQYLNRGKQKLFRTTNALIQLLAFSGGHTRSDGPFAIEEAVDDCLSLHEDRIAASRVEVEKKIPRNLPPCSVPDLAGALNNVVQNALDAMPEGGKLTIRAKEAGKNVAITVGDTGPGVAEEDREKIFEPFFSTRASQTSTGLGLSLCRDSLRQHGGDVRLTSCDNGAEFEILVPADEQE
jgi:two-component system sensor histidine kinase FlrB